MPVDPSQLSTIIANAKRTFGSTDAIHMGNETVPVRRVSWGSVELDMATWGGAPMGRLIRLWGAKSTAKSMTCWNLAQQCMMAGLTVAYYNAEGQYDEAFTRDRMKIDISKLILVEGGVIEDLVYKCQGLLNAVHVHIIDSVGHTFSKERAETVPGAKMSRASKSRAWSDLLPDLIDKMDKSENMIVVVDQVRVNQKYGHEEASASAIFDHTSSMDLHHKRIRSLYKGTDGEFRDAAGIPKDTWRPTIGDEVLVDGVEIGIEVNKSRVCRPFGKARLRLDLDTMTFDRVFELKKVGVYLGVIEKSGAYYKVPGLEKPIHGEPKLRAHIANDFGLVNQIMMAKEKYLADNGYKAMETV